MTPLLVSAIIPAYRRPELVKRALESARQQTYPGLEIIVVEDGSEFRFVERLIMKSFVSVIIPTHNRAAMVRRAVASVLRQTYPHLECIVVDDASTDDTAQIVAEFGDGRIRYLRHERNKGASAARNTGIAQATGELIAFLDDDDEWLPAKLEKQVPLLQQAPEQVGLVYCWLDYYRDETLVREWHPTLQGYVFDRVLDAQRLGNSSTLLVRREVVETVGGFDESLPRGNDGDFIRRVCRDYEVDYVPEVLVYVFVGHTGITASGKDRYQKGIKAQLAKLNKFQDELKALPEVKSSILLKLAHFYCKKGDLKRGRLYYLEAITISPSVLRKVYKQLLATFLGHKFYNTKW